MTRFETKALDPVERDEDHLGISVDDAITTLQETTSAALTKQASDYKALEALVAKLQAKAGRPGGQAYAAVYGLPIETDDELCALLAADPIIEIAEAATLR